MLLWQTASGARRRTQLDSGHMRTLPGCTLHSHTHTASIARDRFLFKLSREKLQLCQQSALQPVQPAQGERQSINDDCSSPRRRHRDAASISLQGIKNFGRCAAASTLPVYRCAALNGATPADVIALASIDGKRLGRVIDLRNDDEIVKGPCEPDGGGDFYRAISNEQLLINRPLLGDIDGFWGAVADQAPPLPVFPKIAMLWSSKPLDVRSRGPSRTEGWRCSIRASSRALLRRSVGLWTTSSRRAGDEAVVFHCAKGKDRTGIVAALVESVCGVPRSEIVDGYAASGALLGGDDAPRSPTNLARRTRVVASIRAESRGRHRGRPGLDRPLARGLPRRRAASTRRGQLRDAVM